MAEHWNQLSKMIDANYINSEYQNTNLFFNIHHNTVKSIKETENINEKIIAYQLEPLVDQHWHPREKIIKNLEGADEVWDYDIQNIEYLKQFGIEAKFRPPAYSESLKQITSWEEPDIDILFYGSITDYRADMLHQMIQGMELTEDNIKFLLQSNFVWLYNVTDKKLDEYIARSKIILNLKPYSWTNRQQQTRIFYPVINDKCVLSEKSDINYFGDNIHEFSGVKELQNKIVYLLKDDNWKNVKKQKYGWVGNNNKEKIAIFYHVYQTGNWESVFEDQIHSLQKSSLYDLADYIHIGINGDQQLPYNLHKVNRVKYNEHKLSERDTILDLHNFAKLAPNYKILFMHAKGVTWHNSVYENNVLFWRKYIEHFTIDKWKECVNNLNYYDTVGTEWEDIAYIADTKQVLPHYAGNFWWANASYISKLDPYFLMQPSDWPRHNCEFWIGTKAPNRFNFFNTNLNKYDNHIDPSMYMR